MKKIQGIILKLLWNSFYSLGELQSVEILNSNNNNNEEKKCMLRELWRIFLLFFNAKRNGTNAWCLGAVLCHIFLDSFARVIKKKEIVPVRCGVSDKAGKFIETSVALLTSWLFLLEISLCKFSEFFSQFQLTINLFFMLRTLLTNHGIWIILECRHTKMRSSAHNLLNLHNTRMRLLWSAHL